MSSRGLGELGPLFACDRPASRLRRAWIIFLTWMLIVPETRFIA